MVKIEAKFISCAVLPGSKCRFYKQLTVKFFIINWVSATLHNRKTATFVTIKPITTPSVVSLWNHDLLKNKKTNSVAMYKYIYIISEALLLCTLFELAKRRSVYQKAGDFCVKLHYIPQNFWKFSCATKVPFREYLKLLFNIFDDVLLCSFYDGVHIIALMYSSWLVREREREKVLKH